MKKLFSVLLVMALLMTSGGMAFAAGSADESLDKLAVSKSESTSSSKLYNMFPKFDPEIADYYVFLPDGDDSAYIYAKPEDSKYTVYCDGDEVDKDDDYFAYIKNISDGDEIEIEVRDRDDDELDTYTITFFCGDDDDDDEARLDDLSIRAKEGKDSYTKVSLDKDFSKSTKSYSVSVKENDYDTVRIYAEPQDSGAHVIINGEVMGSKEDYMEFKVKSGKNEFEVNVIAENCDDSETYKLTVNYDSKGSEVKTEAVISSLSVKDDGGNNITLSPVFNSGKKSYTASVGNNVKSVNFYAMTGTDTSMFLNNTEQKSAIWSPSYTVNEGQNNFTITVYLTGDSYDAKTYTVSIYKHPKKIMASISAQNLNINGVSKQLKAFNIGGNNFVKLRDIASLLAGTNKQFSVGYNETANSIALLSNGYYAANGQENTDLRASKEIMISVQPMTLDNQPVSMVSYNIDGNNFVMLRDVALLFNFGLTYNSAIDTVQITTSSNYTAN